MQWKGHRRIKGKNLNKQCEHQQDSTNGDWNALEGMEHTKYYNR